MSGRVGTVVVDGRLGPRTSLGVVDRDVLVDIEAACLEAVRRRREEARRARAPRVRLRGSVGTAGLSALVATALTLAGEREGDRGPRRARAATRRLPACVLRANLSVLDQASVGEIVSCQTDVHAHGVSLSLGDGAGACP